MKTLKIAFCWGAALLSGSLVAQVREAPVVLALVDGGNPRGYVQNANDQGVFFATTPGGQAQLVPYSKIRGEGLDKLIRFEERNELLADPRNLFTAGRYNEAAELFGKIAGNYAIILAAPQNFASEALFYQMESLKRAGQYAALAPLVNSAPAATIATKLPEAYQRPFEFHKLWALYGKNDFAALRTAIAAYEEPVLGSEKLLRSPNFRALPTNELSQLSFLRGKVYESEGAKDKALDDFYRTFTLAFGNDILLAKQAMGAAMLVQKQDPQVAQGNATALNQMRSIAYLYGRRFGKESMPAEFQAFAVKPDVPKPAPPVEKKADGEAGEGDGAKKETPAVEEKPAPEGKEKAK